MADIRLLVGQLERGEVPRVQPADPERYGPLSVLMRYYGERCERLGRNSQELKTLMAELLDCLEAPNLCNPALRRMNAAKVTRALELVKESVRLADEIKGEAGGPMKTVPLHGRRPESLPGGARLPRLV